MDKSYIPYRVPDLNEPQPGECWLWVRCKTDGCGISLPFDRDPERGRRPHEGRPDSMRCPMCRRGYDYLPEDVRSEFV